MYQKLFLFYCGRWVKEKGNFTPPFEYLVPDIKSYFKPKCAWLKLVKKAPLCDKFLLCAGKQSNSTWKMQIKQWTAVNLAKPWHKKSEHVPLIIVRWHVWHICHLLSYAHISKGTLCSFLVWKFTQHSFRAAPVSHGHKPCPLKCHIPLPRRCLESYTLLFASTQQGITSSLFSHAEKSTPTSKLKQLVSCHWKFDQVFLHWSSSDYISNKYHKKQNAFTY